MDPLFLNLALSVSIATVIAGIMKLIKQPLIVAYIITGVLLGPAFLNMVTTHDYLLTFSEIGIAFLLFIVGLDLNLKFMEEVGAVSAVIGLGQVVFTSAVGYVIILALGFSSIDALYIGLALAMSSTIIVVKILSDKRDLDTLYGRICLGILIVQDLVAIFVLIFISNLSHGGDFISTALSTILNGGALIIILGFVVKFIFPKLLYHVAKSQELLFLFGLSWCFMLSAGVTLFNFSLEIGALIAGITLASTPYHYELGGKIKSLRDFFIILFFVSLGSQMTFLLSPEFIVPAVVLSLFVLVGNPLIVMILMGALGYKKKTGLYVGMCIAQISEFSLVLVALGSRLGHIGPGIVSLVTLVGMVTILGSTYMMIYNDKIYHKISGYLKIFEKKRLRESAIRPSSASLSKYKVLLFGYNRIGYDILKSLKKIKKAYLVVDYNPATVRDLCKKKEPCVYGDAEDPEFLDELPLRGAKVAISTMPYFQSNVTLLRTIRAVNKDCIIIMLAHHIGEAMELYKEGASYVIMPHFLGGKYASVMLEEFGFDANKFAQNKRGHIRDLKERLGAGHQHPRHEGHAGLQS